MNSSFDPTDAERLESLKAAILGGLSLALTYCAIALLHSLLLSTPLPALSLLDVPANLTLLIKVAIAFLSGFLFGVTYRYAIRDDQNPQLKAGVVLAFGLVRGLAVIEGQPDITDTVWVWGILVIESLIEFAIAGFTLDWAIQRRWVKPFTSN
ncbi:MAG: hypothetical protein RH949_07505 [Coleofasciculus sp. A1-SPW-01]|uniref:hypothetical protein n=1 Tax=Coleofasciculus sp. A1-SPW-01 TaxID=3070819 RepID=UPI0032FE5048